LFQNPFIFEVEEVPEIYQLELIWHAD
jgi:hypothetical protein